MNIAELIAHLPGWIIGAFLVVTYIVLIIALHKLRRRQMGEIARLLWVIFLLALPLFGPIIFFIVHPGELSYEDRKYI